MKKVKKEFRWFNIMEYEKEEKYLSKRHQEGWKFKRVTFPGIYTFERCEPEKVIYQLDYNKEGIKHQMEYVRMFEDCGWEYLTEFAGYGEENFLGKSDSVDRDSLRPDSAVLYIFDRSQ